MKATWPRLRLRRHVTKERLRIADLEERFKAKLEPDGHVAVSVEPLEEPDLAEVVIYHRAPKDKPGLLRDMAGVLTAHGLDILVADICVAGQPGHLINRFVVRNPFQSSRRRSAAASGPSRAVDGARG